MPFSDEKAAPAETTSPTYQPEFSTSSSENSKIFDSFVHEKSETAQEHPPADSQPANEDDAQAAAAAPQGPAPDSPEANYKPKSLKFWLILLSAFVSMFLVALDRTIISTAIPTITDDFKSLGDIGWYGSAYMLSTAAFQLVWGRIYRFYDLRYTFLSCIVIFEIGSAVCGAAPSSPVFIVGKYTLSFNKSHSVGRHLNAKNTLQ
jgi:hypothetical protein